MEIQTISPNEPALTERKNDLVSQAERCEVTDERTAEAASDLAKMLHSARKKADDDRRSLVDPLNKVVKDINGRYKPLFDAIDSARQKVLGKLTAWQREEQRKAEERALAEAEKARQEAQERAAAAAATAREYAADPEAAAAQATSQATEEADRQFNRAVERGTPAVRSMSGAQAGLRDNWTWEVEDIQRLAAQRPDLVIPDSKAINELVRREKVRRLPGLRIWNDRKTVVR